MKRLLALGLLVGLVVLATPALAGAWAPAPGALRFGRSPSEVTRQVGGPSTRWRADGFEWLAYQRAGYRLTLGFYRGKLGRMTLEPKHPWPKKTALAWAAAFLPALEEARRVHEAPFETYYQQFDVGGAPFEGYVTLHLEGDKVSRLEGEMNWLD